jgi:hypothetical protein
MTTTDCRLLFAGLACVSWMVLGCTSSDDGDPAEPRVCFTDTAALDGDGNPVLVANEMNNYYFQSTIKVARTAVAPKSSELFFDWSGLSKDFVGHAFDPMTDVDTVALILWHLTHEQMEVKLNNDDLTAQDADIGIALYTEKKLVKGPILDFQVLGGGEFSLEELLTRLDPEQYPPQEYMYTVMPMSGTVVGQGVHMVHAFYLDPASDNTLINFTQESSQLSYEVDLQTLTPVNIPAGEVNINVDWSDMTVNGLGREFRQRSIDEVLVAHYTQEVPELEDRFLDLELIADGMWRGQVPAGDDLTLTELVDENGGAFTGIDGNGTWVLALFCRTCGNPAPWFLTRLQTCQ